jgi:NAD(P)-dependent dehydrogenase (short-subunit alcohol dehydrogenase family)
MGEVALIVGAGPRLGAAVARLCAGQGMTVALAARTEAKLAPLAKETGARIYPCDATRQADVDRIFAAVGRDLGVPNFVLFNPAARVAGPIETIAPADAERPLAVLNGAFLVAQAAAKAMVARGSGTILFTGSSASAFAPAQQGPVAMYKFGIRGLAQALARELHPKGVHVGHVYPVGSIAELGAEPGVDGNALPDEIARAFLYLHRQQRSAWTWEIALTPFSMPIP